MKCTTTHTAKTNQKAASSSKRNIQTFEPCGPIMEMLTLEMNNRTRGRRNHHGEKRRMFEDLVAAALGNKYPKLMERFQVLRHEEMN